jgi:hypothetical protein
MTFKQLNATLVGIATLTSTCAFAAETHYWYDGAQRRSLTLDSEKVVVFTEKASPQIRIKSLVSEKSLNETPAPLFSGQGDQRSLPGGVIVTLAGNHSEASARALLVADGLQPVRMLGDNTNLWLIASPAGMESLNLANRLHESKKYQAAQPNWWQPRVKK